MGISRLMDIIADSREVIRNDVSGPQQHMRVCVCVQMCVSVCGGVEVYACVCDVVKLHAVDDCKGVNA